MPETSDFWPSGPEKRRKTLL